MWIFTTIGFFSAVEDRQTPGNLLVRARVKSDLERLRQYVPQMGAVSEDTNRDYRYRASVAKIDFAVGVSDLVQDIEYNNFKGAVGAIQGPQRAHIYSDVWAVNLKLEDIDRAERYGRKRGDANLASLDKKRGNGRKRGKGQPAPEPEVIVVRRKAGAWKAGLE